MNVFRPVVVALAVALGGCAVAPQLPVPLAQESLEAARIGVGMTALPKVDTSLPGAGCLLCLAAAAMANQALTTHTQTLGHEDLPQLKDKAAAAIRAKGADATVIAEPLGVDALPNAKGQGSNMARKDFSSLRAKYQVDKLLVIDIDMIGMLRTYSSYFPTSDPKAAVQGQCYLVNLANNTYEWYVPLDITRAAEGAWDEPPSFPGLTNAYYQVLELTKDSVLNPLTGAAPAPASAAP